MKNEPPHFLIIGANFINKGAEAMMKTVQHHIIQKYPNAKVFTVVRPTDQPAAERGGFVPITNNEKGLRKLWGELSRKIYAKLTGPLGLKPKPFADETPLRDMRQKINKLDMVLDASGYAYSDQRGYRQPEETMKAIKFARDKGAKFKFMPQAWGPFEDAETAKNVREMLQKGDGYFVRDSVSQKFMAELLSKKENEIAVYPDLAFTFPKPSAELGAGILKKLGWQGAKKLAGISPNMRVYQRVEGKGQNNDYIKKLKQVGERLLEKGYQIVLVPNEILPFEGYHPDDRFACRRLYEALDKNPDVFLVDDYHSAEEIKSVIGHAEVMVASRFHSLIFALSQGIPSLAISWSHKYRELFKLFALEKYVVEDTGLDENQVLPKLDELLSEKEKVARQIEATLPKIREKLAEPIAAITDL